MKIILITSLLAILALEVTGQGCHTTPGLLLTGGGTKEVELYNPVSKTSCALPALPGARLLHSQDGPLLCGGNENTHLKPWKSCLLLNPDNGTWIQSHALPTVRHYHCSWTPKSGTGTFLIGGAGGNAQWTSDLVKPDGTIVTSFRLKHKTVHACSIQEDDRVIITGGHSDTTVSVYDETGWKEDLSNLKFGRMGHACTSFVSGGKKLMMVSGGAGWGQDYTDTSEIWDGSEWRLTTGKLPYTGRDQRMAFIDNRILFMGGHTRQGTRTTILSFNLETEEWTQEGDMLNKRSAFGISVVNLNDYAKLCNLGSSPCNGWAYNTNTKKCYKFVPKSLTFTDARNECKSIARSNGGGFGIVQADLASVHSLQEVNFLNDLVGTPSVWLGATLLRNGQWAWTDGSEWDFEYWIPGLPQDPENLGAFVIMANNNGFDGRWNNQRWSSTTTSNSGYVCQYLNINQFSG